MSKRKRFVITSFILSLGFVAIQFLENQYRFLGIGGLGLVTLILFFWSLKEGLGYDLTLSSLILPCAFTLGVGLFWFLLPVNLFTRIPIVIFYGIGIYALCLTANIYTVAAIRTIALLRAARGVGFILSLITFFLIYDTVLSLKLNLAVNTLLMIIASVPLYLQGYWTVELDKHLNKKIAVYIFLSSLIIGEVATLMFFWPVTVAVGSLFLTTACYILLGLGQASLEGRLFKQTVREYLMVGAIVFIGMFFSTRWGG